MEKKQSVGKQNFIIEFLTSKKIFKTNNVFGKPIVIAIICLVVTFLIFSLTNYILVAFSSLLDFLKLGTPMNYSLINAFNYSKLSDYDFIYVITFFILIVINIRLVYLMRISFKEYNIGQKGTSRFATLEEVQSQYREIDDCKAVIEGKGGIPVCRYQDKLYIDDSSTNNLIIGITRSGKGEMLVFPMVDIYSRATIQSSLVITDPKLELYASSKATLKKRGYDVHLINLVEPLKSSGYNPLAIIVDAWKRKEYSTAEMLCNSFTSTIFGSSGDSGGEDGSYFINASKSLTSALILALIDEKEKINKLEDVNMYSVFQMFSELSSQKDPLDTSRTLLDLYFANRPVGDKAKSKYAIVGTASERQKGNVFSVALAKLEIFTYTEIAKMTANNDLNLNNIGFGEKPQAVFLGIPDYDSSNHYLASVFISQLYFVLAKQASLAVSGKCEREVVFILDEFGNLPAIDNMENIITVCLGRNIKFNLVIQSYSQIEKLYGKASDTIIGNCGNQFYIQSADLGTSQHFSELIGSKTITTINRSGEKLKLNKNFTEMYDERPLLNSVELQELKTGELIVKRVMKRTDLQGNDIVPHAIFCTRETKFKFRFEYLIDEFPNISILSLHLENRNNDVDLISTILDFEEILNPLGDLLINDLKQAKVIKALLCVNKITSTTDNLKVAECIDLLNIASKEKIIKIGSKEKIISLIKER